MKTVRQIRLLALLKTKATSPDPDGWASVHIKDIEIDKLKINSPELISDLSNLESLKLYQPDADNKGVWGYVKIKDEYQDRKINKSIKSKKV